MRNVIKIDSNGYKRRYLVRDQDGDDSAAQGIPVGPPDLRRDLDMEAICKEINNSLADQGIFTWDEVGGNPVGLSVICSVFKRHIAGLLKETSSREKKLRSSS